MLQRRPRSAAGPTSGHSPRQPPDCCERRRARRARARTSAAASAQAAARARPEATPRALSPRCTQRLGPRRHAHVPVQQSSSPPPATTPTRALKRARGSHRPTWAYQHTRLISGLHSPLERAGNSQWEASARSRGDRGGYSAVTRRQLAVIGGRWWTRSCAVEAPELGQATWWGARRSRLGGGREFGSASAAAGLGSLGLRLPWRGLQRAALWSPHSSSKAGGLGAGRREVAVS